MEEKSEAMSLYDYDLDISMMIDQDALVNLLIRKGILNRRELNDEIDRLNEEIRKSFVN